MDSGTRCRSYPKIPRKNSKAVPEGDGLIPQEEYMVLDGIALEDLQRRIMSEAVDKAFNKHFGQNTENPEEMRATTVQRSASLEQDAWQPRLAIEADVIADKKTRNRTEGAAAANRAKHIGDSSSASQVDPDQMCSTSFGMKAKPSALPRRDEVLVDKGAAAPKPCLSPVEMRTRTAAGGLRSAGTVSTATMTIFHQPPLWFCLTEEIKSRTSNQYVTNYSSFWRLKVLEKISRQTLVFNPGGSIGRLRACPFLGTRRALLCGEVFD